jgi:opacity protein-like surface antigen
MGDLPDKLVDVDELGTLLFENDISSGSAYFEGFFAFRINRSLLLEISVGATNRGSVHVYESGDSDIGNLSLYPLLVSARFYPISMLGGPLQPYVSAGGGMIHGRRSVDITTNYWRQYGYEEDSRTDFTYTLGAGADFILTERLALNLNGRYLPIDFSEELLFVNDYEALTVTVGLTYLYQSSND